MSDQQRRSLESHIRNSRDREAELEAKINGIPDWAERRWKFIRKLDETVSSRMQAEKELSSLSKVAEVVAEKLPRIFMVCVMHSKPGEPILATMKHLDGENWVAICPACIEAGKALQAKVGLRMSREEVQVVEGEGDSKGE